MSAGTRDAALDAVLDAVAGRLGRRGADPAEADRALWCSVAASLLDGGPVVARLPSWFGTAAEGLDGSVALLRPARASGALTVRSAGAAFERRAGLGRALDRRDNGVYFTPPELAGFVVRQALAPLLAAARTPDDVLALRACDPAAGAGAFALPSLDLLAARTAELSRGALPLSAAWRLVLARCLYLVDADSLAVALLRSLLCAHAGATPAELDAVESHVVAGDSVVGPPHGLDWRAAFPDVLDRGGFDVVLGNPPWGTVKPAVREYVRAHAGAHAGALTDWDGHRAAKRSYAAALRAAGYRHQGPGDTELYRYFLERAHQLLRPGGRLGVVVPSALQRAEGAAPLRRLLLRDGTAELMADFVNSRRIFAIHGMFRFLVLVWQQGHAGGVRRALFGCRSIAEAEAALGDQRPVAFDVPYLLAVSGARLTVPDVRSATEASLLRALAARHPALGARDAGGWNVRFVRELDMTMDAGLFTEAPPSPDRAWCDPRLGELLPLYEGRMVHQFDAAAKRYLGGQARAARWQPLIPAAKGVHPHYLVPADSLPGRRVPRVARAAFCDVTGHANERTVLAALVPAASACGNKVPTCRFDVEDERLPLLWLALANSFVVDWVVRRRVSTTLNFFLWEQVPLPRLDPGSRTGAELVALARRLCAPVHRPWPPDALVDRARWRARIDALVAEAYGVDLHDMAVILADFPLLDRGQGSGGSTITRDTVLAALAAHRGETGVRLGDLGLPADGGPADVAERVAAATARGEVAYVPGELAAELRRAQD
ncbi:MAG: Eco57I restriction-modification methylase domain-containing protein [Frankiaceae bacterium]